MLLDSDEKEGNIHDLAIVCHELRSPLTSIQGFVEAMLDDPSMSFEQRTRYLTLVLDQARLMARVVSDLGDEYLLRTGRVSLSLESIDLAGLARTIVEQFSIKASEKSIIVDVVSGDGLPPIIADRYRLSQAIGNLLDNALRYTPEGGNIVITVNANNGSVRIAVSDNGIGISEDELGKVWEQSYRVKTKSISAKKGMGLGLAIVRSIAALHGGETGAESVLGKGSTFWITFPVCQGGGK